MGIYVCVKDKRDIAYKKRKISKVHSLLYNLALANSTQETSPVFLKGMLPGEGERNRQLQKLSATA